MNKLRTSERGDFEGDEALAELLRAVEVPETLAAELVRIPDEVVATVATEPPARKQSFSWQVTVIAACYLILLLNVLVFWPNTADTTTAKGTPATMTQPPNVRYTLMRPLPNPRLAVAGIESIESKMYDIKIAQMEARLKKLTTEQTYVGSNDRFSIAMAIGDSTAKNFGASKSLVKENMEQVKTQFPKSLGAEIASQFVSVNNLRNGEDYE